MTAIPQEIREMGAHSPLTEQDLEDFSAAQQRIYNLMRDGEWHPATRVIAVADLRSGLRVMRTFRAKGWQVNKQRTTAGSREWEYQLVEQPPE